MVLGFCISDSTAAVYTGDMASNPTWSNFIQNISEETEHPTHHYEISKGVFIQ